MSTLLRPGFVPPGWERGQLLDVETFPRNGRVSRHWSNWAPMDSFPRDETFYLFDRQDKAQVGAWLAWWYLGD